MIHFFPCDDAALVILGHLGGDQEASKESVVETGYLKKLVKSLGRAFSSNGKYYFRTTPVRLLLKNSLKQAICGRF